MEERLQAFQQFHHLFPLQDQVAQPVIADAFLQLVTELELVSIHGGFKITEGNIGILSQVFANLIQVGRENKEGGFYL